MALLYLYGNFCLDARVPFFWGCTLHGVSESCSNSMVNLLRSSPSVSRVAVTFSIPAPPRPTARERSGVWRLCRHLLLSVRLVLAILVGVQCHPTVVSMDISLMAQDA